MLEDGGYHRLKKLFDSNASPKPKQQNLHYYTSLFMKQYIYPNVR